MESIPDDVINKRLYKKVKDEVKSRVKSYPSAYASQQIVKEYKDRGGKYKGSKDSKGVSKWNRERWIQVEPYLKNKKIIECGNRTETKGKACRPLIRIDDKTPITISELLKIHSKSKLLKLANEKQKNPERRINWKKGTISKK